MNTNTFSRPRRHQWFSFYRIATIAGGTFTQLIRMKVFALLAVFAVLLIASSFAFSELRTEQELKMMKDLALAAMAMFSMVFAVAGTAVLLPRDVEDRTLYTILCKPVPRLEYLLGKLTGVASLLIMSLLFMDIFFCGVLYCKQRSVINSGVQFIESRSIPQAEKETAVQEITERAEFQGVRWPLQAAVYAIFLKSVVLAAVALLLSTFSTSTLFTIMASLSVLVIGHLQALARDVFLGSSASPGGRLVAGAISLVFPDFKSFDITDDVIRGMTVPLSALGQMTGLTVVYLVLYSMAAYYSFSDKEL